MDSEPEEIFSKKFRIRCHITGAQPYIHLRDGAQMDETRPRWPVDQARFKRSLDASVEAGEAVPASMLAREHHDSLVQNFKTYQRKRLAWSEGNVLSLVFSHADVSPIAAKALAAICREKGVTDKHDDLRYLVGTRNLEWFKGLLPDYRQNRSQYHHTMRQQCMAMIPDRFVPHLQSELDRYCDLLTSTSDNAEGRDSRRAAAMRKALRVDTETGDVYCNRVAYDKVVDAIIEDLVGDFENRLNALRKRMSERTRHVKFYLNDEPKFIRELKHALGTPRETGLESPLTPQQARDALIKAVDALKPNALARRLLQIALDDQNLTISITNQEKHIEAVMKDTLRNPPQTDRVTLGRSGTCSVCLSRESLDLTTAEELMHHAMRLIYAHSAQPYLPGKDGRKKLFTAAISEDFQRNGVENAKREFRITGYPVNKMLTEIIAKSLAMMATGQWDAMKERYPIIDRYIKHVIAQDVKAFEENGIVDPYGEHTAKVARRRTSLVASLRSTS